MAEIVNGVCLEILDTEEREGWNLQLPVHDGVYVVTPAGEEWRVLKLMEGHAREYGLPLHADILAGTPPEYGPRKGGKGVPKLTRGRRPSPVPNLTRKRTRESVLAGAQLMTVK